MGYNIVHDNGSIFICLAGYVLFSGVSL